MSLSEYESSRTEHYPAGVEHAKKADFRAERGDLARGEAAGLDAGGLVRFLPNDDTRA
jgi:hypothetical protein